MHKEEEEEERNEASICSTARHADVSRICGRVAMLSRELFPDKESR